MAQFCTNKDCKHHKNKKPFQDHAKKCSECEKPLSATWEAAAEETVEQRFVALLTKVKAKFDKKNKHHAGWVLPMLDHLSNSAEYFKADFVSELYKASESEGLNAINLAKLADPEKRAAEFSTSCVDQALDKLKTQVELPAEYPKGEKFDFELPFLLKSKWSFLNTGANPPFTKTVKDLLRAAKAGESYLVIYRMTDAAKIGHAVFITVSSKGTPFLYDAQKNTGKLGNCKYVGWSITATVPTGGFQELDPETGNVAKA